MLKYFFLTLLIINPVSGVSNDKPETGISTTKKIIIGGLITGGVAGAVIMAPAILSIGTIATIKATVTAIATQPTVMLATTSITGSATAKSAVITTIGVASEITKDYYNLHSNTEILEHAAIAMQSIQRTYSTVHFLRQFVCPTDQQKLQQLQYQELINKRELNLKATNSQKMLAECLNKKNGKKMCQKELGDLIDIIGIKETNQFINNLKKN